MKILYLAHRIPYPPNKGDKIRSFNEIKFLSRKNKIYLGCLADDHRDIQYEKNLREYCDKVYIIPVCPKLAKLKSLLYLLSKKPLSIPFFHSRKLQKTVDHLLVTNVFDYIICFSSPMAEYIFRAKGNGKHNHQTIMDLCDVDSDKWHQYGQVTAFPMSCIYKLESKRLVRYERKIAEQFKHVIVISEKEAAIFKNQNPQLKKRPIVIPNGVDGEYFNPDESDHLVPQPSSQEFFRQQNSCPTLLFTGAMNYYANIDGVIWFCKEIFPKIKQNIPQIEFYIVGSNPHKSVKHLQGNDNGVKVTGFVEDIRPYYKSASICTIPLRLGRGVQNKVLEAMAMGKAIVCTSKAVEGINVVHREHLLIEDKPEGICQAILRLLADESYRNQLGRNAQQYVKEQCNWFINLGKFDELIQ